MPPIISCNYLAREVIRKSGIHIFLYGQHVGRLPALVFRKQIANLARAVMSRETAVDSISVIEGERILVGSDDHAGRGIIKGWQLLEGNEAVPFELARAAVHRHVAIVCAPNRKHTRRVVADIAVHVGVNEVLAGPWK